MFVPDIVAVTPQDDYHVEVIFEDGKIVDFNAAPIVGVGAFERLKDKELFKKKCTIVHGGLAWRVAGCGDPWDYVGIDPNVLYWLKDAPEPPFAIEDGIGVL